MPCYALANAYRANVELAAKLLSSGDNKILVIAEDTVKYEPIP
jgi:hypothetical protein